MNTNYCSYLVCGHIDITEDQYNVHYKDFVRNIIENECRVYTGGATGVDTFVAKQCNDLGRRDLLYVYDKKFNEDTSKKTDNYVYGFPDYPSRDDALVKEVLKANTGGVYCRLYSRPMSYGSGSFHNLVNYYHGKSMADNIQADVRGGIQLSELHQKIVDSFSDCLSIDGRA